MSKNIQKLIDAIQKGNTDQIRDLVSNQGYDINAKDENGTPVIFYAFQSCNEVNHETITTLKTLGANFNIKTANGKTFLNRAVEYENLELVKLVLTNSVAQINMMDNDGAYPLLIASEKRNEDMVRLLAEEFAADINKKSKNGDPLIFSVLDQYNFKYDMAMLLIELGVDVNQKNSNGEVPLKFAVQAQKYDVIEAMLQKGALPNAKNREGNYILHFAYKTKNEDIMRLLVKHGADINCKNQEGDILLAKALGVESQQYCDHYDYKMANLLLELGANTNIKNKKGESIIFKIIAQGKPETLDLFLDRGGKMNVLNNDKKSPVQFAMDNKNPEMLASLFKHGATCANLSSEDPEITEVINHYAHLEESSKLSGAGTDIPQDSM